MQRRGVLLASGIAALVLLGTCAGASAHSLPEPTGYVGEWTPDNASPGLLAGESFTVAPSDEAAAAAAAGLYSLTEEKYYCGSTQPGVPPVSYFTVTEPWSPGVTLGGCESAKTGGHLYTFYEGPGPQYDQYVLYAHTETIRGMTLLNGGWEYGSPAVTDKFKAHHPLAQFLVHGKLTTVTKSKKKGYVGLLGTFAAAGEIPVVATPTNCASVGLAGGYGSATLRLVKIGGPNLVELDNVTVTLTGSFGSGDDYQSCASEGDIIRGIAFKVTKSDPHELDSCPIGSEGDMTLVDHSGQDEVVFRLPKCKLSVVLRQKQAKKGSHLAVAITLNEKGY